MVQGYNFKIFKQPCPSPEECDYFVPAIPGTKNFITFLDKGTKSYEVPVIHGTHFGKCSELNAKGL